MNDKKLYEEISKLNELVLHKGLVPTFEEIINQLEKQKEVLDKIKEKLQNELDNYNVTMGKAEKIELLELLEEIE